MPRSLAIRRAASAASIGGRTTGRQDRQPLKASSEEQSRRRTLYTGFRRALESALTRALRTGRLGFEDLKRTALAAMAEMAAGAIRSGLGALFGGGKGLGGTIGSVLAGLIGAPGRATGGDVAPGRAFLVGERGPELFVPATSGRVEPMSPAGGREVRLNITINAAAGAEPEALRASGRQVARAVRQALLRAEA